jgi:hypothetical protein
MQNFSGWTYYKVGSGQAAQAMGLAPGSIIGVPSADARTFYVLRPMDALGHGLVSDGPTVLAELQAAGDATEQTDVAG